MCFLPSTSLSFFLASRCASLLFLLFTKFVPSHPAFLPGYGVCVGKSVTAFFACCQQQTQTKPAMFVRSALVAPERGLRAAGTARGGGKDGYWDGLVGVVREGGRGVRGQEELKA